MLGLPPKNADVGEFYNATRMNADVNHCRARYSSYVEKLARPLLD